GRRRLAAPGSASLVRTLGLAPLRGHGVVLHDLALEDPHLDAARAVGGIRRRRAEIDVGAKRMQWHAALAVPLRARDLGAAETAAAGDLDALGAQTHGRLHGALHGAAEGDAALELLGDRGGNQARVDLRLAHLDNVDVHLGVGELGHLAAQLLDVGALLADDDARTGRVHGDAAFLVRA